MRAFLGNAFSASAVLLIVWSPGLSRACAVCMSGRDDETRAAFLGTTIFLSLLPVLAVGGVVIWLRRRLRKQEQDEAREQRSVPARPPGAPARA
jgi:hypothetical protein